ncbi:MAG: DNA-binding protein [Vampirovibrionales bacterium]
MAKDLINASLERQNVLNNLYALQLMQENLGLQYGRMFQGQLVFLEKEVAEFYGLEERTIDRYLSQFHEELVKNGYQVLKGKALKAFKGLIYVDDINVVDIDLKAPQLAIFTFKAFLNIGMLLSESEKAKQVRSALLDTVIQVITERVSSSTRYINQRDEAYLPAAFQEESYRKQFTDALDQCIHPKSKWLYVNFTNRVYQAIFEENAQEYRKILSLSPQDNVRHTFYAEVLDLIAAFEAGFAETLRQEVQQKGSTLTQEEAGVVFEVFAKQATFKPLIHKAKTLMASRDYALRDAFHYKLESYIRAIPELDYERFLGERSKALEESIQESLDVYKRLRDR